MSQGLGKNGQETPQIIDSDPFGEEVRVKLPKIWRNKGEVESMPQPFIATRREYKGWKEPAHEAVPLTDHGHGRLRHRVDGPLLPYASELFMNPEYLGGL